MHEVELHTIKRVLSGDTDAYRELVKRYEKSIVNYIFRYILVYEEALDIAQEVFVKAYYALEKYDRSYRFSTWIYRIARNTAIDYLRKKQVNVRSLDESQKVQGGEVAFQVPAAGDSPEERIRNHEFIKHFNEAIRTLPLEYREVITLRHINEYSYCEIAEICDIPIGTVKNRIFRGRELLRKKLEGKI